MNDIILLKLGEIVLKGLNRKSFEQKLVSNVRRRLAHIGKFRVYCLQSTVYVEAAEDGADMDAAFEALQKVFGIVKLSRAAACEKDKDAIAKLAIDYLRDDMLRAKSFKVESKRSDKSFPMTSVELSQYVGGELNEAYPNVEVDVHDPRATVLLGKDKITPESPEYLGINSALKYTAYKYDQKMADDILDICLTMKKRVPLTIEQLAKKNPQFDRAYLEKAMQAVSESGLVEFHWENLDGKNPNHEKRWVLDMFVPAAAAMKRSRL